jgi:photosystem II stability/assembly factor-like uncharacterized protein
LSKHGSKQIGSAILVLALVLAASASGAQSAGPEDSSLYSGLVWRNIGPFRGGRISAVSGVVGQPGVFYVGLPGGGGWKTTDAGVTWNPIFDSVKEASSVGAVAVAPSDPNVIYVGMGDLITGGGINEGNGVYKSTDAGKTWEHLGPDDTKQIPSILVDPHNPDIVMVAAQGNIHAQSDVRGLYRSTDGGKTWEKTLFVDRETGIQKIAWAYDDPNVMLATTVRHYNAPGQFGRGARGEGGTKLFKSVDEGQTWKQLDDESLPELSGRTCVAVAMNTHAKRMFLVGNFGLFRSDDGGETWDQMDAGDRRVANGQGGYNCGVYVDTQNPDTVYVINTSSYRSLDGGKTFTGFKGAPGGDDPQQMWIDPTNSNRLLLGTDQGATVSLNAGETWSPWYNQATAQVYHISVDNSYPYWVYATQQDSGSVATRSRGDLGEITPLDWLPTPGYEFGSIVPDPLNPKIVYAGGPGGGIVKISYPSGQWIDVSPNMDTALKLRKVGNQPLVWSPTDPHELFTGFQYLMATTDGGKHWKELSPDLGYPKGVTPPKDEASPTGPARPGTPARPDRPKVGTAPTPRGVVLPPLAGNEPNDEEDDQDPDQPEDDQDEQQGGPPRGGSIESVSPSSVNRGVIWIGTNNGLIKLTKDQGHSWEDVSIPKLDDPERADVCCIEASREDPSTAYAAVDYHGLGNYKPYFYKTKDFGRTWTKIVEGMRTDQPSGSFARVIRSDPKRAGLLFAGTESSVYVSFDDGDHWQSLMLNLPNTSYRDMVVKENDLVVGTYGRGFWILDDISPLRQLGPEMASEPAHLFKPGEAIRVRRNVNEDTPFPPEVPHALNPPAGAIIYYHLSSKPQGEVTLDINDSQGARVSHQSSRVYAIPNESLPPVPDFWIAKPSPLATEVGTNRAHWNLRYDSPPSFSHTYEINANPGLTPPSPLGPLALPGTYKVTLVVDGNKYEQKVKVVNDPRSPASFSDLGAQNRLQMKLYDGAILAWNDYHQIADMKTAITAAMGLHPSKAVTDAAEVIQAKLTAIGGAVGGGRRFGAGGRRGAGPRLPSFAAANGTFVRQLNLLDSGDMAPTQTMLEAYRVAYEELKTVCDEWKALNEKDLGVFNAALASDHRSPISAAPMGPRPEKP